MPVESIETQWSRELRADVEIRAERGEFSLYLDGIHEVTTRTLAQIEDFLTRLWILSDPVDGDAL